MSFIPRGGALAFMAAVSTLGCSSSDGTDDTALRASVVRNYAANLRSGYSDSVQDAKDMQTAIEAFIAEPTEDNLTTARTAWLASRAHYMLTEGARFYGGPIDQSPPDDEALLNSWPLDESYIDYSVADDNAGIVNHPEILAEISSDGLDALNGQGSDESISSGYHAVEFLLWGHAPQATGPGERPASDYDASGPRPNADRRARYLSVAVEGIIAHLGEVNDGWAPGSSYRTTFEANPNIALTSVLTGLAKFSKGELGSQRIGAAYQSKERRDQHDCFSSETLTDYERDALGVQAMYLGNYGDNDGPGIDELVKAKSPEADTRMKQRLEASIAAIRAIPKPFEASIVGDDQSPGRVAIAAALAALSAQGDEFANVAEALGSKIQVDDP